MRALWLLLLFFSLATTIFAAGLNPTEQKLLDYYNGVNQTEVMTPEEALDLATTVNRMTKDDYMLALSRYLMAWEKYRLNDLSCIYDYLEGLRLLDATDTTDAFMQCQARNNMGTLFVGHGNIDGAMGFYTSALKYAAQYKEIQVAKVKINMGIALKEVNPERAMELYFEALKVAEQLGSVRYQAQIYNNLGVLFNTIDKYDLANDFLKKTLMLNYGDDHESRHKWVRMAYHNLGDMMIRQNAFDSALVYLEQAVEVVAENDNYLTYMDLGECYIETGQYEKANQACLKALELYPKVKPREANLKVFQHLAKIHEGTDSAVYWKDRHIEEYRKFTGTLNSLMNVRNKFTLESLVKNYDREVAAHKDDLQFRRIVLGLIVLVVAILSTFYVVYQYKMTRKKRLVAEAMAEIDKVMGKSRELV